MKKVFIGVDFSKLKFDAVLFEHPNQASCIHQTFENQDSGFKEFIKWIKQNTSRKKDQWLICGEHTGLYSLSLTGFMNRKQIDIWLESPLQIKRSMGIIREKTDQVDALHIALYAYRYQDKALSTKLRSDALDQLKDLQAFRQRLIGYRTSLEVSSKELTQVKANESVKLIASVSAKLVTGINSQIKQIEQEIKSLITNDSELYLNYQLLTSIKGIGAQNATMVLIITGNFSLFDDPRKFGCYAGVVPFSHSSGTSLRGKDKVSSLANKAMKALLTEAARSAIRHDPRMREYYVRKLQEGKDRFLVLNNVRNKLIHIMFAVVRNKQTYDPQYNAGYKQPA